MNILHSCFSHLIIFPLDWLESLQYPSRRFLQKARLCISLEILFITGTPSNSRRLERHVTYTLCGFCSLQVEYICVQSAT